MLEQTKIERDSRENKEGREIIKKNDFGNTGTVKMNSLCILGTCCTAFRYQCYVNMRMDAN